MAHDQTKQRVGKAFCAIDGTYWNIAKLSGVGENLFWLLYALEDGEFHTQKQICADWQFPRTTINTLTKACEAAGYITLQSIPGRKRELRICLTEAGQAYAQQVLSPVRELERQAMRNCAPTFASDLEAFASELQAALERHQSTERD